LKKNCNRDISKLLHGKIIDIITFFQVFNADLPQKIATKLFRKSALNRGLSLK